MRNFLAFLAALLIAALTAGWCRSWYSVGSLDAEPGKTAFRVEVDRQKIASDARDAGNAVRNWFKAENKDE
jgi:hypothetical protein